MSYSKTYPVEVTLLERDENGDHLKETIEVPFTSSSQFFKIMESKEVREGIKEKSEDILLTVGRTLVEIVCPKVMDRITPASGIMFMTEILNHEKETLGLGKKVLTESLKGTQDMNLTPTDSPATS